MVGYSKSWMRKRKEGEKEMIGGSLISFSSFFILKGPRRIYWKLGFGFWFSPSKGNVLLWYDTLWFVTIGGDGKKLCHIAPHRLLTTHFIDYRSSKFIIPIIPFFFPSFSFRFN